MVNRLTIKEVLSRAIQKEIESQNLYTGLSQKMVDQAARDAFTQLAQQEKGHQDLLEQYQLGEIREGALMADQVIDYKIAECFNQPGITPDMQLKDIFLLAAKREKASHELYLRLAGIHPAGKIRRLLDGLASQELEHKHRVELLYSEVAFPQTDGG